MRVAHLDGNGRGLAEGCERSGEVHNWGGRKRQQKCQGHNYDSDKNNEGSHDQSQNSTPSQVGRGASLWIRILPLAPSNSTTHSRMRTAAGAISSTNAGNSAGFRF